MKWEVQLYRPTTDSRLSVPLPPMFSDDLNQLHQWAQEQTDEELDLGILEEVSEWLDIEFPEWVTLDFSNGREDAETD